VQVIATVVGTRATDRQFPVTIIGTVTVIAISILVTEATTTRISDLIVHRADFTEGQDIPLDTAWAMARDIMALDISEGTTEDWETLALEIAGEAMAPVGSLRAVRLADPAVSASGRQCITVDSRQ